MIVPLLKILRGLLDSTLEKTIKLCHNISLPG